MKMLLALMGFLSAVTLCFVLNVAGNVFIPMVIAWFILQMLRPIVKIAHTLRFNAWWSIILVFAVLALVGLAGFKFIASQVVEFGHVYSEYSEKLIDWAVHVMQTLSVPPEAVKNFDWFAILRDNASNISSLIIALSTKFVMTFVFLMFMMLEAQFLDDKINKAFGKNS